MQVTEYISIKPDNHYGTGVGSVYQFECAYHLSTARLAPTESTGYHAEGYARYPHDLPCG